MVEERWNNHNGLEEPPTNTLTNGIKPLPISQIRIPKIVRPGTSSDANPPSRDQDIADREQLRSQLTSLQALLEKTSKKGGDLIRNYRGRDVNQCPQYAENLKLQQDVEKRIEEVKGKLFEVSKRLGANKEEEKKEEKKLEIIDVSIPKPFLGAPITDEDEDISFKVFNDPGCHWCKQCDIFVSDLAAYLQHLQSEKHWKACETKEEPWRKSQIKPKIEIEHEKKIAVEIKGTHTLMPVRGYYCQVCGVLLGSQGHAEDHLKTNKHNRCFNRHAYMNGQIELNYSVSKSRSLSRVQKLDAKRQREQKEKEEREKESKKRCIETEIKKRMTEEKDKENRSKKNRESSEKTFQESKTSSELSRIKEDDRDKKVIRDRERERERSREKDRERDRDREKDRDKDKDREKTKSSIHKPSSFNKDRHKEKVKDRERDKERESYKNKSKRHDDSKKSEKPNKSSTIIEPVDDNVFGPHFPFHDRKLGMKAIVHIPKNEWQLCWKKHMKLMMKGKLPTFSAKLEQESVQNSEPETIQKPPSPPPPQPQLSTEAEMEAVDSSIGDLVLSINYDKDSDNEFDKDNDINLNSTVSLANDMFTVEFDDECDRPDKIRAESDFVVSQDSDFPRFEPLVINNVVEDETFSMSVTDTPMLSPPMWVQPMSLHDLAE